MPSDKEHHIASLVVRCRPEALAAAAAATTRLPGAEVHQRDQRGQFVVSLEADHESELLATLRSIEALRGVMDAALVYHAITP